MAACPRCSSALETPLGCLSCGALIQLEREPEPFEALGLQPAYDLDAQDLHRRLLRLSRLTHPDYFATAGEDEKRRAERATAILNASYSILADDASRADWLVGNLGGPDENEERAMPQEFLMEVLEWNETLDEARQGGAASGERVAELRRDLEARRTLALDAIGRILAPLPPKGSSKLREARRALNVVRYIDRTLSELEALRLSRAEAR